MGLFCVYMYVCNYVKKECFLSLEAVCVCVSWGHLDVWGELASHKRSLTHCPSSQGWASRCPYKYMFVCQGYGWVGYFTSLFFLISLS